LYQLSNMRPILLLFFLFLLPFNSNDGQVRGLNPVKKEKGLESGTTRAVVVGISDYQNEGITDLRFADQDARVFADYLLDPKGLALDSSHVEVLVNDEATAGNFISALYGLIENSKEGDQAIIYFAGHGDVESTTISQPGFLLCWDAPSRVYMAGGTFGLNYLQEIVATLSSQIKSKVIVITDACRSGKLAGSDIGGANATAAHMAKQVANEVKIMSCQPQEFSLEGEEWGGGRGVFSYYLMAGLQGMADRNEDQEVTLFELRRYLEDNVVMAVDPHSQVPMTVGSPNTRLAKVNPELLAEVKAKMETKVLTTIQQRAAPDAALALDTSILKKYEAFQKALKEDHLLEPKEGSAWSLFQEIKGHPSLEKYEGLMRRNLAAALQDKAQQAINNYLAADPEELKKRWSYSDEYEDYPIMLRYAADLLGKDHFYYKPLIARAHYFEGVNLRLKGMRLQDTSYLTKALIQQDSALKYEPHAPFSVNEKAYTYINLNQFDKADTLLEKVLLMTPKWMAPLMNYTLLHIKKEEFQEALFYSSKAFKLDSQLVQIQYNKGLCYYNLGQIDSAIFNLELAIKRDSNFALPFIELGKIYFEKDNFTFAEYYFKRGLSIDSTKSNVAVNLGHTYLKLNELDESKRYFDIAQKINPKSLTAYQGQIEFSFYTGDLKEAESQLLNYVIDYPEDNFAYYLLSSIAASREDIELTNRRLRKAIDKGFNQKSVLLNDKNFDSIKSNIDFQNLLSKLKN
jgi:tetratricopeptide (TPR) repeat protein